MLLNFLFVPHILTFVWSLIDNISDGAWLTLAGSINRASVQYGRHQYHHLWRTDKTPDVKHGGGNVTLLLL